MRATTNKNSELSMKYLVSPPPSLTLFLPRYYTTAVFTSKQSERQAHSSETTRLSCTYLWKIFHRKPWSGGALMCGGALYGLWYAIFTRSSLSGLHKYSLCFLLLLQFLLSVALIRLHHPDVHVTACLPRAQRRGQSFNTTHEGGDVTISSYFQLK